MYMGPICNLTTSYPFHHAIHADCLLPDTEQAWFYILICKWWKFPCSVFITNLTNLMYWFMHTISRFNGFRKLAPTIQNRTLLAWPSKHTMSKSESTNQSTMPTTMVDSLHNPNDTIKLMFWGSEEIISESGMTFIKHLRNMFIAFIKLELDCICQKIEITERTIKNRLCNYD